MPPCHLIVAPGGDPSPIAGMIWALRQLHSLDVQHLHLIFYQEAHQYYQREFIAGYNPAQQLHAQGHHWQTHIHLARTAEGTLLQDDTHPDDATRFVEAIWSCAVEAQNITGDQPVIFSILGGRRRTLTVDITLVYQLLARPQDLLFDLRPTPKEVSGPESGFYFPTQTHPNLVYDTQNNPYQPSEVQLELVSVRAPRLRPLLTSTPKDFREALYQSEVALRNHEIPELTIHLSTLKVFLNLPGQAPIQVNISPLPAFWYALLAFAAQQGARALSVRNPSTLTALLEQCTPGTFAALGKDKSRIGKLFLTPEDFTDERTKVKRSLTNAAMEHNIPNLKLLLPRSKRSKTGWVNQIDLPASHIRFADDQG
jgi:CRISPR-associated protein (TIGR02584 family)